MKEFITKMEMILENIRRSKMKENKEVIETNFNNFNEQLESIKRLEKLVKLRKSKNNIKYDNCICSTEDLENVLKEINI